MSVFVAINNFELESLSFTEQNIITKNQMNPLGVLFTLEEILYRTWLVYSLAVGKACWFPLYCYKGSTGQMNTQTTCDVSFLLTMEK